MSVLWELRARRVDAVPGTVVVGPRGERQGRVAAEEQVLTVSGLSWYSSGCGFGTVLFIVLIVFI